MFKTNKRKNLIIITFDQWRGDWGNPSKPITSLPCMKMLAKNGWTAEHCYTSSPQCVPARLSWITGLTPSQIGVTENKPVNLPDKSPSIVRDLKQKGWVTGLVGKTHWSSHDEPTNLADNYSRIKALGFDLSIEIAGPRALQKIECAITEDWRKADVYDIQMEDLRNRYKNGRHRDSWMVKESILPNNLYPDIWIAEKGLSMLDEMPINKPWLLWISFVGPHEPFDTPRPWKGKNENCDLPKPIKESGWIKRLPKDISLKNVQELWHNKLLDDDIMALRRDYADHLQLLDSQTMRILEKLESRKDANNTGIVVTADHGEMLGDHNILYKSTFLEGSVHVPFIYRPPNKNRIRRYENEKKELGLTELLKKIVTNMEEGGSLGPIRKWAKRQKGAISEFRDEIMFISNRNKMVYKKNKGLIWWTNLITDPNEYTNLAEEKEIKRDKKIKKQITWAEKILEKRSRRKWVRISLDEDGNK